MSDETEPVMGPPPHETSQEKNGDDKDETTQSNQNTLPDKEVLKRMLTRRIGFVTQQQQQQQRRSEGRKEDDPDIYKYPEVRLLRRKAQPKPLFPYTSSFLDDYGGGDDNEDNDDDDDEAWHDDTDVPLSPAATITPTPTVAPSTTTEQHPAVVPETETVTSNKLAEETKEVMWYDPNPYVPPKEVHYSKAKPWFPLPRTMWDFKDWMLSSYSTSSATDYANRLSRSTELVEWKCNVPEMAALKDGSQVVDGALAEKMLEKERPPSFRLFKMAAGLITEQLLEYGQPHLDGGPTQNPDLNSHPEDEKRTMTTMKRALLEQENMRKTSIYKGVLSQVQWQRDNYIVGSDYANIRNEQRANSNSSKKELPSSPSFHPLLEEYAKIKRGQESMAHLQLRGLGQWFLPSSTVMDAARPQVLYLANFTDGPLRIPLRRSLCDIIPLSQDQVDSIFKSSIITFLADDEWKHFIKGHTGGYITSSIRRE